MLDCRVGPVEGVGVDARDDPLAMLDRSVGPVEGVGVDARDG